MNRVDQINRGMSDFKPLNAVDIPSLEGKVSDEEWAIIDKAAGRPIRVPAEVVAPFMGEG